jgi:hypothetical protein
MRQIRGAVGQAFQQRVGAWPIIGGGDLAGRIRTANGDLPDLPPELTGLVGVTAAYALLLLVDARGAAIAALSASALP